VTPPNLPLAGLLQTTDVPYSESLAFLSDPARRCLTLKVIENGYRVSWVDITGQNSLRPACQEELFALTTNKVASVG